MPQARKNIVNLSATPYYHCISRCVRRAYLCGKDALTGKSYQHRRRWVESRLLFLGKVFGIDICAYAVMSNHTHLVLHVDRKRVEGWSTEEVLHRWHKLHKGMAIGHRYLDVEKRGLLTEAELKTLRELVGVYRRRLHDISWFMRLLNEPIARKANAEDECTGRFWEGRFKSQALLDETALAACMAYVDLNPIRAGVATSLATSSYTSIKRRLHCNDSGRKYLQLMRFARDTFTSHGSPLPFTFEDYHEAVMQSSVNKVQGKASLSTSVPAALIKSSAIPKQTWHSLAVNIENRFGTKISRDIAIRRLKQSITTH
ncbi:transposase [Alteromonas sp. ASW11-19]|uniref:Transposase n=1 Tax=Alteromonas salexigens TaxID=2982530 RepID=A0ABT2VM57_9ALTE|nr:transposase [Alteromonas salexigens]MCU7554401.1 transposase [Alteromonas salexigens]